MNRFYRSILWICVCTSTSFSQAAPTGGRTWDLNDVTYIFPVPSVENESLFIKGSDFIPRRWLTKDLVKRNGLNFNLVGFSYGQLVSAEEKKQIEASRAAEFEAQAKRNIDLAKFDAERAAEFAKAEAEREIEFTKRWDEVKRDQSLSEEQKIQRQNELLEERKLRYQRTQQQQQQVQGQQSWWPMTTVEELNAMGEEAFDRLKMVAFRIDPCFKDHFYENCRKQVRVVWQPFEISKPRALAAVSDESEVSEFGLFKDAAVHTFYDLNEADFSAFLKKLAEIKKTYQVNTRGKSLTVHPGFKNVRFLKSITDSIKIVVSSEKISRIAFMQLETSGLHWRFSSFDVVQSSLKPMVPAHLVQPEIDLMLHSPWSRRLLGDDIPVKTQQRDQLLNLAFSAEKTQNQEKQLRSALRVENPNRHLPGTIDCISCHVAPRVKERALKSLGAVGKTILSQSRFKQSGYNLTNQTRSRSEFRALGYFGTDLEISDRVINESAAVAEQLNQQSATVSQAGVIK